MTREEAIEYLKRADITVGQTIKTRTAEALEMAIEALQTEPYFWEKCPYYEPDIMFDGKEEYDWGKCTYKTVHSDDRKNCPHRHENGNCLSVGGFCLAVDDKHCQLKESPENFNKDSAPESMLNADLISRQAVLSEIETVCFSKELVKFRVDYGSNGTRDYIINYIKQLPSVQPEQKEITTEDVKTYCESRNLVVLTKELFDKMNNVADEVYLYLKDKEGKE